MSFKAPMGTGEQKGRQNNPVKAPTPSGPWHSGKWCPHDSLEELRVGLLYYQRKVNQGFYLDS